MLLTDVGFDGDTIYGIYFRSKDFLERSPNPSTNLMRDGNGEEEEEIEN